MLHRRFNKKCRLLSIFLIGIMAQAEAVVSGVEEILVTARGIEEPIEKVPFALSAFEAGEIKKRSISEIEALYRNVPNFNYTDSGLPEANLINIRGIGSSSTFLSPSVTYYIDGVPVPQRAFDLQFIDIERIEVLRGPQGTLFGQNSQAGAVSILTRKPTDQAEASFSAQYSSFDSIRLTGGVSGLLSDNIAGRVSILHLNRDGDIENVTFSGPATFRSEESIRARENTTISGQLLFSPTEETHVTLSGRWQEDDRHPTTGLLLDTDEHRNALSPIPTNQLDSSGYALTIEHAFDNIVFTSITGYVDYDLALEADITDGFIASAQSSAPPSIFALENAIRLINEDSWQWTQEFRLAGENASGTTWVTGSSFLSSEFNSATDITSPVLPNGQYSATIDKANVAIFGEVTQVLSSNLRLISGLRFTDESSNFQGVFSGRPGGAPAATHFGETGETSDNLLTGRVALSYDIKPTLTSFVSVARGAKAGGYPFFNQSAAFSVALEEFGKSTTWAYETGVKGRFLQDTILFSSSIFFNDTNNEQLFIFNPVAGQFQIENANTKSYGFESEFKAKLSDRYLLQYHLALLETAATESNGVSVRKGNEVPYAPGISTGINLEYTRPANLFSAEGEFRLLVDYQYVGSRQIDPANSKKLASYSLSNFRFSYITPKWSVYTYVNNAFDKEYIQSGFAAGISTAGSRLFGGVSGDPRIVGIGISFNL